MTSNNPLLKLALWLTLAISLFACSDNGPQKNDSHDNSQSLPQKATKAYADSMTNYLLKDTQIKKDYDQRLEERQLNKNKKTMRAVRSVKECIKPNDLIDDEVQMCVSGTLEKYW